MTPTRTTCPYCGVGCGLLAFPDGRVKGDPEHPANFGRLCSKGTQLGETIGLEGRLLAPRVDGQTSDWDTALGRVADRFSTAIRDHGPDSVAFYVSGQLLTEDYYVANKLMKGYIGSANIDTNSRLCMSSSVAGHKRAFGTDTVPGTYEDIEQADLVVLVGSNLAWCHPVLYQRLVAAKKARPSMRVVNIDPRRTATCGVADMHLAIAPDGDVALWNAVLARVVDNGAADRAYVAAHVNGFDDSLASARASDPAKTASVTGLSPEELDRFTALWAATDRVVTIYSQGVNQSRQGTDKVNAILNCHLATGRIGKPGMGPFSVTGQPNAMGGREVGGLANMLAGHLDIENPAHRTAVQTAWNSPTICSEPGLKAIDLFKACADGKIKALWVMSTNPAVSMPDAMAVADAIRAVPFVAVSDIMADTDTTALADVVLPATGWGEKSGTVTNSERRISRQRSFLPVPGQARPDWQIIADVAKRMGWGDDFAYANEAAVFREYAALSALGETFARDFDISGLANLDDNAYDALAPVFWPAPAKGRQQTRFFADGGFFHADGKARMIPVTAHIAAAPDKDQPFRLNTGRVRDHWHTMTRTGKSARLSQHMGEPYLEIHPEDAIALGLHSASLARLTNDQGSAILRVLTSPAMRRGEVFAPMHWTARTAPAGRINALVASVTDPVSGQPASKGSTVRINQYDPAWYGFVCAETDITGTHPYHAIARAPNGWNAEVAGADIPQNWEQELRTLTGIHHGEVSLMTDTARSSARVALTSEGRLMAMLFASPGPVTVARGHISRLIGSQTPAVQALAGRSASGAIDPGAIICSCLGVGVNTIRAAIAGGASSVEALGNVTQAGTSCGSCRPELAALIDASRANLAAE